MRCLARHFAALSQRLRQLVAVLIAAIMFMPSGSLRAMALTPLISATTCASATRVANVCSCGCQEGTSAGFSGDCCCSAVPDDSPPPADQPLPGRGNGGNRGDELPLGKLATEIRTDAIGLWMLEMSRHQYAQAWVRGELRLLGEPAIRARFGSHVRQHAAVGQWLT